MEIGILVAILPDAYVMGLVLGLLSRRETLCLLEGRKATTSNQFLVFLLSLVYS